MTSDTPQRACYWPKATHVDTSLTESAMNGLQTALWPIES